MLKQFIEKEQVVKAKQVIYEDVQFPNGFNKFLEALIVENIIGALKASTLNWLPGNQLSTIADGGTDSVSYTHALTFGGAYVFVGLSIAVLLFVRRDVAN
jgi:hypothetical protein